MSQKAKFQITKARAGLIIDQPFFASLLLPMPIHETKEIDTLATDGECILYNPDFIDGLTQNETTFGLAHEVLHCVFDHMGRRESRTPNRWNQAADYIINDILVKEKIGTFIDGCLLNPALVAQGKGTAEGVYRLLPESAEKNKAGKKGGALDNVQDGKITAKPDGKGGTTITITPLDPAGKAKRSAEGKIKIIQATNAARMQGKLSAGLDRLLGEMTKPVVDWREVLRRFVSERAKIDYSFARPKRRFLAEDFYLPSLTGEKMGRLAVAVDCSGSVDDKLLAKFGTEINAIRDDVHPAAIDVLYFDSKVLRVETFSPEDTIVIRPCGGGGTNFSPVFKAIGEMPEQPIACVFLTDLECSDFGPAPEYPVLWAVLQGKRPAMNSAPFGEVLQVSEVD